MAVLEVFMIALPFWFPKVAQRAARQQQRPRDFAYRELSP